MDMYSISEEETKKIDSINSQWNEWWNGSIRGSAGDQERFYVSTAINYTNGLPHMGHAYEAISADIIARYHRIFGRNTFFLTGSDEHGQKIAERAAAEGVEPIDLCNKFSSAFQTINSRTFISNDRYVRTTEPQHYELAKQVLEKSIAAGDVYLSNYNGWYNVKEEAFVSETEAKLTDYKDPSTGVDLVRMEEESYFFKLSKYQEALVNHFEENPSFVQPDTQRNFILKRLKDEPLQDLSISRTNFKWGIPFPGNENHVLYVWFDALTNYLTGIDYPSGERAAFWPASVQLIGKDIVWFHTVIWPAMLLSAGIPLPKQIFAHGFVNDEEGKKMSKSKGNVVDPHPILDKYTADSFRLFLMHNITFGNDLPFCETNLVMVHNADLADSLGNLVNRVTNITNKYFKSSTPDAVSDPIVCVANLRSNFEEKFNLLDLGGAYMIAISATRDINNYLTTKEPWKIKEDPENAQKSVIIRSVLEALYIVAHFLAPFIPVTSQEMFQALNTAPRAISSLSDDLQHLTPGTLVAKRFSFQKYPIPGQEDNDKKVAPKVSAKKKNKKNNNQNKQGGPEQPVFTKLDLRVGEITKVWKHPDSSHLWCEEIDVGGDTPIQVCSGLQKVYTLEQMQGTRCIVVNNLRPSKLGGVMSYGMVLCAKSADGSVVEFVTPPEGAKNGERVYIEGADGEPVSAAQVKKRKIWEEVALKLCTNSNLQGTYDNSPLLTSAGPCTVKSAKDCPIS